MTTRRLTGIALMALGLCASPATFGWGADGHRIIAALAQQRLTASAQAAVMEILAGEDLVTASTWADEMRASPDNVGFWSQQAASWHYINIPPGQTYASSTKNPAGDALMAIEAFTAILLNEPVPQGPVRDALESYFGDLQSRPQDLKRFALRFLIHVLGDLQQPLHMGYADDRGGNAVQLRWFGKTTDLHTLWDTQLIAHAGLTDAQYTQRLANRISRTPASDVRGFERSDPEVWEQESRRMLERIYSRHRENSELGDEYVAQFVPTVEIQMIKGGLRTAWFLNNLFGGWSVGTR